MTVVLVALVVVAPPWTGLPVLVGMLRVVLAVAGRTRRQDVGADGRRLGLAGGLVVAPERIGRVLLHMSQRPGELFAGSRRCR